MKRATEKGLIKSVPVAISIHALVKRATFGYGNGYVYEKISIHALVKRATFFIGIGQKKHGISIHALVKRATTGKT